MNIIIADDEPIIRMDIKEILEQLGYNVVAEAKDGFEALEACKKHRPDVIIMDIKMPVLDGLKASKLISNENLGIAIVLLTAYSDKNTISMANESSVLGYITKPVDAKSLMPVIEVAYSNAKKISKIEVELDKTKNVLESRKLVDKAKGILMEKNQITENEAYNFMRKEAMNRGCKIGRLAEIIIISNQ